MLVRLVCCKGAFAWGWGLWIIDNRWVAEHQNLLKFALSFLYTSRPKFRTPFGLLEGCIGDRAQDMQPDVPFTMASIGVPLKKNSVISVSSTCLGSVNADCVLGYPLRLLSAPLISSLLGLPLQNLLKSFQLL